MPTYEELYANNHAKAAAWVAYRVPETDRDDVVQRAWLQVFRNLRSFRNESAFSTWLYQIVQNEIKMHYRRTRRVMVPLTDVFFSPGCLESRQRCCELIRKIDELPARRRHIMRGLIEGKTHREIARELKCTAKAVKSQVCYTRKELRRQLQ